MAQQYFILANAPRHAEYTPYLTGIHAHALNLVECFIWRLSQACESPCESCMSLGAADIFTENSMADSGVSPDTHVLQTRRATRYTLSGHR